MNLIHMRHHTGQKNLLIGDFAQAVKDTLNRLTTLTPPRGGTLGFDYDELGRRTDLTRPNGIDTTYGYDAVGQLLSMVHGTVKTYGYTYDNAGNRLTMQEDGQDHTYGYDNIYRLLSATHPEPLDPTEQFSYDGVGNRVLSHLSSTHVVDAANRLLEDDTYTYTYDLNGNLITKTDKVTTDTTTYTWTVENKLRSVQKPDASIVIFRYDSLGRRIEKRTEVAGEITTLTRFVYDGIDILFELDADGNITKRYTHGPGIDEPLMIEIDSDLDGTFDESAYYHTDGLGSVTVLTDTSGTPVKTYRYDAFGNVLEETGTLEQAYFYTGREWDAETGMYYYRTRYYDAVMGRFLAEDPIGLVGSINLYSYCFNNPVWLIDPFGYSASWPWTWWDINPIQAYIHAFYDAGAAFGEPFAALIEAAELMEDRREEEFENAADPNAEECPTQYSDAVEDQVNELRDNVADLAGMPGAGLGGPVPTPPTSGQEIVTDLITNAVNRSMNAANSGNAGETRDTAF